jgi:predicted ABC-type ATPase
LRLDLVVGPNGAGKSTLVRLVISPAWPASVFVNADTIAAQRWPGDPEPHAYEAAEIAARTRSELIDRRVPFIAETVFSHPSKLDLLRNASQAGFYTALHVVMVPADLAVVRVAARVAAGGHSVPEEKIRGRYRRLWNLVAEAIGMSDTAACYDGSRRPRPLEVSLFSNGFPVGQPDWPEWAPPELSSRWPAA